MVAEVAQRDPLMACRQSGVCEIAVAGRHGNIEGGTGIADSAFLAFALSAQSRLYICSIILSPNTEHLISVAPSMSRAKSYVTRFEPMAPSMPLIIRSAASVQPMKRSIISPE